MIQNRVTEQIYFIKGSTLDKYEYDGNTIENAVHFILPDNDIVDVVDEYENTYQHESETIIIHFHRAEKSFKIDVDDLYYFELSERELENVGDSFVSFILPTPNDLIERIPAMRPAMLQSNTQIPG